MRVLVIGSGAREHALLLALRRDPDVEALAVAPGNAGTASVADQYDVDITSGAEVVALAKRFGADLVVVGPEVPLVLGVADAVRAAGIACFGPSREGRGGDRGPRGRPRSRGKPSRFGAPRAARIIPRRTGGVAVLRGRR